MEENKKFIESLRRLIKSKKLELGVDSSISDIKGLSKYIDLESIKIPKSFNVNNALKTFATKRVEEFQNAEYSSLSKDMYIFEKISTEVSKKVSNDMMEILANNNPEENINKYILDKTDFKNIKVSLVSTDTEDATINLAKEVFSKLKNPNIQIVLVENTNANAKIKSYYGILNTKLKASMPGEWRRTTTCTKAQIRDFILLITIGIIIKDSCDYFGKDINRAKSILKERLHPNRIFEENLSYEDVIKKVNSLDISKVIEESRNNAIPISLIPLFNYCIADIVKENNRIMEYDKSIRDMDKNYAKPYMTKKNITKKIKNFMGNNSFLNMFGYVEADETCELEKLNRLEEEFIEFSTLLPMPVLKDQSLRFRRLGNIKADGVYYYIFNSLCVNLDGVYSFTHEMLHMIDFKEGLLSLNNDFKQIINMYTSIVNEQIERLDKSDYIYTTWHSKKKYNKDYYLNGAEIFARMGEIYVSEILGIKSSLVKRNFKKGIDAFVYPVDEELLSLTKVYFDNMFESIKNKHEVVSAKVLN